MFLALALTTCMAIQPIAPPARLEPLIHLSIGAGMVLQGADLAETMYALGRHPDRVRELNPLYRSLLASPTGFAAVKMGSAVGFNYFLLRAHKRWPRGTLIASLVYTGISAFAVIHNARLRHALEP